MQNMNVPWNTVSQVSLEGLSHFVNKRDPEPPTLTERGNLTDIINDQPIYDLPVVGKQENISLTHH